MLPDTEPISHEMHTKYEHNGVCWVECPECGRLIIVAAGDLAIVQDGDRYASHSWGTGGLQIGGVSAEA